MHIVRQHNPYGASHNIPKTIVVHAMAEFLPTADGEEHEHASAFLENVQLSAHALVEPDGTIIRLREDGEGAYHAKGFNTDSLGIEVLLAGQHNYDTFGKAIAAPWVQGGQYLALVYQCQQWLALHKIERVVRHSDLSPGRKIDPGAGFPWEKFLKDIRWSKA